MRRIEEDNGIYNRTRDTWKSKQDADIYQNSDEEDASKLNILDAFAVEIDN